MRGDPRFRLKALLLDLDDTLLDYSGDVDRSWSEACATCAAPLGVDTDALACAIARSRRWFWDDPERHRRERVNMLRAWENIVVHALDGLAIAEPGLAAAIARDYARRRRERMRLFPDAKDCLERLRRAGISLALVTNGDASQQRDKIERHGLEPFFDVIVIEGEFGTGKPDEKVYRHALAGLAVDAPSAWMVGDNLEFDVAGPQRLGVTGVWIDRAGRGLPEGSEIRPDRVIRSLRELTDSR